MITDDGKLLVDGKKYIIKMYSDGKWLELAPVKQANWRLNKSGSGTCSNCHFTQANVWDYDSYQRYCGVCGAKMSMED